MDQVKLPEGFKPMATQVAGHTFQQDTEALGLVQDPKTGCVLKPLGKPACGERELHFYETTTATSDPLLAKTRNFIPKFMGSRKLVVNERQHTFLQLEDLTLGMSKPCIMDVKIGKRTWDPQASPQKRDLEEQKYVNCKQVLGLCVPGFQLYKADEEDKVLKYGKDYGKQLDADGFRATIALFLNSYEPLVREILNQLKSIHDWFKVQTLFHFYASSLLIVYDFEAMQIHSKRCSARNGLLANGINSQLHNAQNDKHTNSETRMPEPLKSPPLPDVGQWVKVKMIDFAHVFPAEGHSLDTNYLFGLQNFIAVIEDLLVR